MRKTSKVTIQRRGTAQDTTGQRVETWSTLRPEWASIESVSGREFFSSSGERAEVTHKIIVWSGSGVAPRDRVLFGDRVFDIRSVLDADERAQLALMCVEVVV